jgi:thioredoxin reductase
MTVDVLIVGAGPAGLAAAIELRRLGTGQVMVVDREQHAGGVPRHCAHTGYGVRDLRRLMTGPAYARRYAHAAASAGAIIRTSTTLTGWREPAAEAGQQPPGGLLTSPAGLETVWPSAVLLATGCRERPRAARLVPGSRPAGVLTTGELQQRVYLQGQRLPGRAVIIGAEHVSFSAMLTLTHAGARVVALVTDQPRHQSLPAFALAARLRWRVPVRTHTSVTRIAGRDRVQGIELHDQRTGVATFVPCDTVVFTADWIPDYELSCLATLQIDAGTRGPAVGTGLETSRPMMFAAGNLIHAAETADLAALSGRHAARQIAAALRQRAHSSPAGRPCSGPGRPIQLTVAEPLLWISPNAISDPGTPPPRGRFVLRAAEYARLARLEVRQDGKLLAAARTRLLPGRSVHLDAEWITRVDQAGGPVSVRVR